MVQQQPTSTRARAIALTIALSVPLTVPLAACDSEPTKTAPSSTPSSAPAKSATASAVSATSAIPPDDDTAYAKSLIGLFGPALKKELLAAMSAGGPTEAVAVCNEKAPGIADTLTIRDGWQIRRTSLQLRNPDNAPDAWERKNLEKLEADKAAGKPIAALTISETIDGEFRYLQAIGTDAMCLTCHGKEIAPEVAKAIDEKYPKDAARGFNAGDLRGAFSIRHKL